MSLDDDLTKFRENFYSVHCLVERGYIVYRTKKGYASQLAEEANKIIEKMGLNLSAIPTTLSSKDSFVVQSSETPDI